MNVTTPEYTMTGYRILVCGSRNFAATPSQRFNHSHILGTNPESMTLAAALDGFLASAKRHDYTFNIIHGGCPTGADAVAQVWCNTRGIIPAIYEADWSKGRRAGPERNRQMVATLDPNNPLHFVIAGWDLTSAGTRSTLKFAADAGIESIILTAQKATL